MAGLIIIGGAVSLVAGILLHRKMSDEDRGFWILSRVLIGFGVVSLGYLLCGQLGYSILLSLWR